MIYRGNGNERYGDEIMVLQENIIVFKGFLRPQGKLNEKFWFKFVLFFFKETFTFKFKRSSRRTFVKLEFLINELFECCLTIDYEQKQIEEKNQFFQLDNIQIPDNIDFNDRNKNEKSYDSKRYHHSNSTSIYFIIKFLKMIYFLISIWLLKQSMVSIEQRQQQIMIDNIIDQIKSFIFTKFYRFLLLFLL